MLCINTHFATIPIQNYFRKPMFLFNDNMFPFIIYIHKCTFASFYPTKNMHLKCKSTCLLVHYKLVQKNTPLLIQNLNVCGINSFCKKWLAPLHNNNIILNFALILEAVKKSFNHISVISIPPTRCTRKTLKEKKPSFLCLHIYQDELFIMENTTKNPQVPLTRADIVYFCMYTVVFNGVSFFFLFQFLPRCYFWIDNYILCQMWESKWQIG